MRSGLGVAGRAVVVMSVLAACGCGARGPRSSEEDTMANTGQRVAATLAISSSAFQAGQPIPAIHTCDGGDRSPRLGWSGAPPGTRSLALICDDPDAPAGTWSHWVLWGMPPATTELPESVPPRETGFPTARQGTNDFRRIGYGGPCPPPGKPHRYFFRLYALDTEIELEPSATRQDLLATIEGHVLAQGELMGTYQRAR